MLVSGKKLPNGFMYALSKKDFIAIDNSLNNIIESIHFDGPCKFLDGPYKPYYKSTGCFTIIWIYFDKSESGLKISLKQYGVRSSDFTNKEYFFKQKEIITSEIIEKIKDEIQKYANNNLNKEEHRTVKIKRRL